MSSLFQDLRYGLRGLWRRPVLAIVAVSSLALGIGANTAIFSLFDAVLLKQLPVQNPTQLVALDSFNQRGEQRNFSHPMFERLRASTQVFSGIFASVDGTARMEITGPESDGQIGQAEVQLVSGEYFQVLGVNASIGRTLTAADDQVPDAHPVAVLSYNYWRRRFSGDVSIIGRRITLKQQPFTIIGVTPREFFGEAVGRAPDVWAPVMMEPVLNRGASRLDGANIGWLRIMARRQPGVSEAQAQAAVATALARIKSEQNDLGSSARNIAKIEVLPGRQGLRDFRDRFAKPLHILMAGVLLVLLIACANVANLLLARATERQKEVAVRLAIGAGRFRLIRQFLTESLLLAGGGGVLGLFLAWWGSNTLLVLVSDDSAIGVTPNIRILIFTVAVSLMTALLSGFAPALIASRQDVSAVLKATALMRPRLSLSRVFVVAQVALSLLLLSGAGLLVQTLRNLRAIDLGFAADQVIQARINPQVSGYKQEQLPELYRKLLEALNSAPGVRSASLSATGFRAGSSRTCCIAVEGYPIRPNEDREVQTVSATPGYFQTMGLPLLAGRDFVQPDAVAKPGEFPKVAVINETMARYYFGQTNPLGSRFGWGDTAQTIKYDIEIVGIVKDANYGNLRDRPRRLIYFPSQGGTLLVIRAMGQPAPLAATIRQEIQAVDKSLEISSIQTVSQLRDGALVQERSLARLSSFFSLLALLLACIGLYGVMSYEVSRRTPEIGIRMALGAPLGHILRVVLQQGMRLVLVGVVLGLAASYLLMRLIAGLLYGVSATDPLTFTVIGLLLVGVALLACYLPARRATKVDPLVALRYE